MGWEICTVGGRFTEWLTTRTRVATGLTALTLSVDLAWRMTVPLGIGVVSHWKTQVP